MSLRGRAAAPACPPDDAAAGRVINKCQVPYLTLVTRLSTLVTRLSTLVTRLSTSVDKRLTTERLLPHFTTLVDTCRVVSGDHLTLVTRLSTLVQQVSFSRLTLVQHLLPVCQQVSTQIDTCYLFVNTCYPFVNKCGQVLISHTPPPPVECYILPP